MGSLNHRVAVVIPSTTNVNENAAPGTVAEWVKVAKVKLADMFGGFTAYSAVGGWMSPVHGLVEEPVTVVSSFTDKAGLGRVPEVKALAAAMAGALAQEAVAVEVDNRLQFIPPLRLAAA